MNNYKRVYFRINTPSYYKSSYGVGFENQEESNNFDRVAINIFLKDKWKIKEKRNNGSCTTIVKDKQELYLHPQSFSGIVLEQNIPNIEQLLKKENDMFKFECTDIYDDIFDISDEEYINILESKKQEIENCIINIFKTKRKNLYILSTYTSLNKVLNKYRIKRLDSYIGVYSDSDIDIKWIKNIFDNLVKQNKIVSAETKNGIGYRAKTKREVA